MAARLTRGPIVPAAVFTLRVGDQLQGLVQRLVQPPVRRRGHAVNLPEHKGRQPVVVHVSLRIGDVQQTRRPGVVDDIIQSSFDDLPVFAAARCMPGRHERQRSHADEPHVVGSPVAFGTLRRGHPFQPLLQRLFAARRHFPISLGLCTRGAARTTVAQITIRAQEESFHSQRLSGVNKGIGSRCFMAEPSTSSYMATNLAAAENTRIRAVWRSYYALNVRSNLRPLYRQ